MAAKSMSWPAQADYPVDRDECLTCAGAQARRAAGTSLVAGTFSFGNMGDSDADPDSGSNPADDRIIDVLENQPDDATYRELAAFIRALDLDEQISLVALAWLGRGTYELSEWQHALDTARSEHTGRTPEYLLGMPLLGDYLEEGLAMFNETCDAFIARI